MAGWKNDFNSVIIRPVLAILNRIATSGPDSDQVVGAPAKKYQPALGMLG